MKLDYFPVRNRDTVVVLGAHMGDEVIHYASLVGKRGRVIAVEPNSENFGILKYRITRRGLFNVTLVNAAMWDKNGKMKLFIGTNSTNHSLMKDWQGETEEVETRTWDSLTENLDRVNLANIDIEGAEPQLLEGMNTKLPKHIILEYHYMFGIDPNEVIRTLQRKKYNCVKENQYIYGNLQPEDA